MTHVCIDVDVWCKWSDNPPTYRVYVDNELLTERDFIWEPKRHYIREHIEVYLGPGWHDLRIVDCSEGAAKFITNDVQVNGKPSGSKFLV